MSILKSSDNRYLKNGIKEKCLIIAEAVAVIPVFDYFFYRSLTAAFFLIPVGVLFYALLSRQLNEKKAAEFRSQFKELLMLSSTMMRAGYSVENAILKSYGDLRYMFGKDSPVCRLIADIAKAQKNRSQIGNVFISAGMQTGIEEIEEFGRVYSVVYEKSGNMSSIMDKAAGSIIEKMEVESEIYTAISKSRFEMKIMDLMPFFIMGYMSLTGRGYFDGMYHNAAGAVVMTICMAVYILSYLWGERIVRIDV